MLIFQNEYVDSLELYNQVLKWKVLSTIHQSESSARHLKLVMTYAKSSRTIFAHKILKVFLKYLWPTIKTEQSSVREWKIFTTGNSWHHCDWFLFLPMYLFWKSFGDKVLENWWIELNDCGLCDDWSWVSHKEVYIQDPGVEHFVWGHFLVSPNVTL